MNKGQLIDAVVASSGEGKRTVQTVIDATIDEITKAVANGDRVALPGFGSFERRDRSARTGRNPQTGETIDIAAAKVPAFKAGAQFKDTVNK